MPTGTPTCHSANTFASISQCASGMGRAVLGSSEGCPCTSLWTVSLKMALRYKTGRAGGAGSCCGWASWPRPSTSKPPVPTTTTVYLMARPCWSGWWGPGRARSELFLRTHIIRQRGGRQRAVDHGAQFHRRGLDGDSRLPHGSALDAGGGHPRGQRHVHPLDARRSCEADAVIVGGTRATVLHLADIHVNS